MEKDVEKQSGLWAAVKEIFKHFLDKDAMTQAAAVAFYAGLSLAPILTVVAWVAKAVLGPDSKTSVIKAFESVLGSSAAAPISQILNPASEAASENLTVSGIISLILVLFAATGVFGQLQSALNQMWDVKANATSGILGYVQKRLLSVGMLLTILFLLLTSLAVSAVIQGFIGTNDVGWWMSVINIVVSLILFTMLFAMMFRYVPDAKIAWSDVWVGGALSALLFVVGKFALSIYLGRGSYESSYGAAIGSFVALLVWVYYSSTILFIGAQATEVYARRHGHPIRPEAHADHVVQREVTLESGSADAKTNQSSP